MTSIADRTRVRADVTSTIHHGTTSRGGPNHFNAKAYTLARTSRRSSTMHDRDRGQDSCPRGRDLDHTPRHHQRRWTQPFYRRGIHLGADSAEVIHHARPRRSASLVSARTRPRPYTTGPRAEVDPTILPPRHTPWCRLHGGHSPCTTVIADRTRVRADGTSTIQHGTTGAGGPNHFAPQGIHLGADSANVVHHAQP